MYNDENLTSKKHTALGISAFVCSTAFIIILTLGLGLASMYGNDTQQDGHPLKAFGTTIIYWIFFLLFVSLFLGIAGIKEEDAKKVFPSLAVLMSLFGIIATIVTILISRSA